MKINVFEHTDKRLKFEIEGKSHTLCNALSAELWNDKDVAVAGYTLEHPLISCSTMIVETNKGDPKKVLISAIDRIKKKNKEYLSAIKKAAK